MEQALPSLLELAVFFPANSGSLSLHDGAALSTVGALSNTGSLAIGAGCTFSVHGNYSQSSPASLTVGIGSTSSVQQYGQLNLTGSATLAGSVNASIASDFSPRAGDSLPIVTYAGETGGDSVSFTGLSSGGVPIFQPIVGPTGITLNGLTSPVNLVVQPFSVAANAAAGQNFTVIYQVDNESSNAATGPWTDSIYLSTQTALNSSSVLLGRLQQTGSAANGQYTGTLTASVPGLVPGSYYVVVLVDSRGVLPELNRTSAELASTSPVQVTVPALTLGGSASGTIDNSQNAYYQITVPAAEDLAIDASFAALQGGELYVGYQSVPTASANLASSTAASQRTQQVVIPDTQAGTYYILLAGGSGSAGRQSRLRFLSKSLPLQVTGVSPAQAGNAGTTTITIQGVEFTSGMTVSLIPDGYGGALAATQVTFQGKYDALRSVQFGRRGAGHLRRRGHQRRAACHRSLGIHRHRLRQSRSHFV